MKPQTINAQGRFKQLFTHTFEVLAEQRESFEPQLKLEEMGRVTQVGQGIARITGLPKVAVEELLLFESGAYGLAFDLTEHDVGVVLLDAKAINAGDLVSRSQRVLDVPVGDALLGRVIDALGRPLDGKADIIAEQRYPLERPATPIIERTAIDYPLQTGIKVVDALIPIGRGQRELILGDRQTGKTSLAIDTILNQKDSDVICIYCAIGQRRSAVANVIATLEEHDALAYTIVVVANGEDPPGLQYISPYAATSIAEYFMEQGQDVLIVYDDLTKHARAYRELSLLLRRPPGREAFPGDVFYLHARLLERATRLGENLGGGSLTALPIIETESQNLSAYIPTNLISITDGQIYLSPTLFQKGQLPAIDVGLSVSRVGAKAQLKTFRTIASSLRLQYTQFVELEAFARFGTRLDVTTEKLLKRGRRIRELLKQSLNKPVHVGTQIALMLALEEGLFDVIPRFWIKDIEEALNHVLAKEYPELLRQIESNQILQPDDIECLLTLVQSLIDKQQGSTHAKF